MTACPHCPFRVGSKNGYDDDALYYLLAGNTPSCHEVVGAKKVFDDLCPDDRAVCKGFLLLEQSVEGYQQPYKDNR